MSSRGQDLLKQAEKKRSGGGGLFSFGSSSSRLEEARDLFVSAGAAFKGDEQWKSAGDAYLQAAKCSEQTQQPDDAANDYVAAAKAYKLSHPQLAVPAYKEAIEILRKNGKLRQAADRSKDVAELYKVEGSDMESVKNYYIQAGKWYEQEDAPATANPMYREAAHVAALLHDYDTAVRLFEKVALASLNSPLTRFSVKEYYTKAGICYFCKGDKVAARRAVEGYAQQDNTFSGTRDYKFLLQVADALDAGEADAFQEACIEYDAVLKLDNWKTSMLLEIRKTMQEEPGLL